MSAAARAGGRVTGRAGGALVAAALAVLATVAGAGVVVVPAVALGLLGAAVLSGVVAVAGVARFVAVAFGVAFALAPMNGLRAGPVALCDVVLAVVLATLLVTGHRPDAPAAVGWGFVAIIASGSVATALVDTGGVDGLARFGLAAGGTLLTVCLWRPSPAQLRFALWCGVAGATANAVVGLLSTGVAGGRGLGFATHPNHLGLASALAAAMAVGLGRSSTGRPGRLAGGVAAVVLLAAVVDSGSRAALLATIVATGCYLVLLRRRRPWRRFVVAAVVAAVLVLLGVVRLPEEAATGRLFGSTSSTVSDEERVDRLVRTVERIGRSPLLGSGYEFAQEGHNVYLQLVVIGGPIALLGYLALARGLVRRGLHARQVAIRSRSPDVVVVVAALAGTAGYFVAAAVQNIMWDRYLWLHFGGLLLVAARVQAPATTSPRPAAQADRPLAVAVVGGEGRQGRRAGDPWQRSSTAAVDRAEQPADVSRRAGAGRLVRGAVAIGRRLACRRR